MIDSSSSVDHRGYILGSSRPEPRPEVPRMIPLTQGNVLGLRISEIVSSGDAESGNEAKAYSRCDGSFLSFRDSHAAFRSF